MSRPHLLVVTGPDGTGKSTLVQGVVQALNAEHGEGYATSVLIWHSLADLVSVEQARTYLGTIDHLSRATLLLHGIARALDLGRRADVRVLVIDGYWYKYAVSEIAHGTPPALFAGCPEAFPTPDLTLCLDLPAEEALARKEAISRYEQGLAEADGGEGEAFLRFQERMAAHWSTLEEQVGPWTHLSSAQPAEALVARTLAALSRSLA